jgi:hypothetical protein
MTSLFAFLLLFSWNAASIAATVADNLRRETVQLCGG